MSRDGAAIATTDRVGSWTGGEPLSSKGFERAVPRAVMWPALALLVLIGAGVTYAVTRAGDDKVTAITPTTSADRPAIGVPASSIEPARAAQDSPDPSPFVDITVLGAPRGARVLLDGKAVGETPGPVALPAGDAPVVLTVSASGYETARAAVVPNQAASATVIMRKRAPGPASSREGIPSDLENPF
jgi:hypothetical protein